MYINKAILFGNLTRDPELRALPSGMNVCNFSIATNRVYKDKDGKKQEQTDFHNVVVFGRQADTVNQYLKKGSSAYIEGRMQTRSWEQNGEKKYRTEVVADSVQFGPRGSGTGGGRKQEDDSQDAPAAGAGIDYPKDDINPDDIPF
ncbi:single-stranded DNA-binding protein [Candidatus Kaiserbacteria bacterium]|nr:single-stranded DNA-binding protein [Candidatus Kaiserbacteria bacterium]